LITAINIEVYLKRIQVSTMMKTEITLQSFHQLLEAAQKLNIFLIKNSLIEKNKMMKQTK
jgi:hypothetical protein